MEPDQSHKSANPFRTKNDPFHDTLRRNKTIAGDLIIKTLK